MVREFIYDLSGRELKVTIGKVAEQANGCMSCSMWRNCCFSKCLCF